MMHKNANAVKDLVGAAWLAGWRVAAVDAELAGVFNRHYVRRE